jgi:glycerol dehydrogenase-like iron-containing ADH family enzyme
MRENTTIATVQFVLEHYPAARNNDNECIYQTLKHLGKPTDYALLRFNPDNIVETIRRARQKLQEKYTALRPAPEVEKKRLAKEDMFHEYCTGRGEFMR